MRLAISSAAAALLRALITRSQAPVNRILLIEVNSTDWQSLTLNGERHRLALRIAGPQSKAIAERISDGLEEAEFALPRLIVADIAVVEGPNDETDEATGLVIEALTICAD